MCPQIHYKMLTVKEDVCANSKEKSELTVSRDLLQSKFFFFYVAVVGQERRQSSEKKRSQGPVRAFEGPGMYRDARITMFVRLSADDQNGIKDVHEEDRACRMNSRRQPAFASLRLF